MTEQVNHESAAVEAKRELSRMGYDPTTFYEQRVVWGDHDSFQCVFSLQKVVLCERVLNLARHVNNVRYGESSRSQRGRVQVLFRITQPDTSRV